MAPHPEQQPSTTAPPAVKPIDTTPTALEHAAHPVTHEYYSHQEVPMSNPIRETVAISEKAATAAKTTGRMLVRFISPGWGSSGYYSPQVLEAAATDRVIPKGTHMYADHPTAVEDQDRPERSIKDLVAVVAEDAYLSDDGALDGEVTVVPAWRPLLEDDTVREAIGVSIRGSATDIVLGEAEGRKGGIIEGLVAPVMSVDFVTRAGRGGKVLQLLESARANQAAIERGVEESTVNDTREQLQQLLREEYGRPWAEDKPGVYVWVRDFEAGDQARVWFELDGADDDDSGLFEQSYTLDAAGAVTLNGERTEVRIVTQYVPVNPAGQSITIEESREDTMPQIEEARLRQLEADAGRVQTLESERDTERQARESAERERDELRARESATKRARARVVEANADLPAPVVDRIVAEATRSIPLTESGQLDETAADAATDAARTVEEAYLAGLARNAGAGTVSGFGGLPAAEQNADLTESDIDNVVAGAFGRTVKEA